MKPIAELDSPGRGAGGSQKTALDNYGWPLDLHTEFRGQVEGIIWKCLSFSTDNTWNVTVAFCVVQGYNWINHPPLPIISGEEKALIVCSLSHLKVTMNHALEVCTFLNLHL